MGGFHQIYRWGEEEDVEGVGEEEDVEGVDVDVEEEGEEESERTKGQRGYGSLLTYSRKSR